MHVEPESYHRVELSEAARAVLCALAAGDVGRPLPPVAADWEEVFQAVCRNGLVGLADRYLALGASRADPPPAFRRAVREARYLGALRQGLLERAIGEVLAGLRESGIAYLVLKGPALAQLVYPAPGLRTFGDLDLMVRERDTARMHRVLVALGCTPEHDPARTQGCVGPGAPTPALRYWHRAGRLRLGGHSDDLPSAGLASRGLAG